MSDTQPVSKGDVFIINGNVNLVFQIKTHKNPLGDTEECAFYKPYFKSPVNSGLYRSIPIKNFHMINQRAPLTKTELNDLLKTLAEPEEFSESVDTNLGKELLHTNNLSGKLTLIKQLWQEKNNEETPFSYSKSNLLDLTIKNISQEIALVLDTSLDKAEKKIFTQLKKLN